MSLQLGMATAYKLLQNSPGKRLSRGGVNLFCKPKYCMCQTYIESATTLSDVNDEEIVRISGFCRASEKDFYRLVRPRNVRHRMFHACK